MFTILRPTKRLINQHFGENPHTYMQFGLPGHEGLDFLCPPEDPIHACAEGDVKEASVFGSYGLRIVLTHKLKDEKGVEWQVETIYAHLSKLWVKRGQHVLAGQAIGLSGNTGNSKGPHLHLTLKVRGMNTFGYPDNIVDPEPFLLP